MGLDSFKKQQIHYKTDINPHNTGMEILPDYQTRLLWQMTSKPK